jgi:hypothetical protein
VVTGTLRRLRTVLAAAVVVAACPVVLGVWPTSVALAAVGMWWGLQAWSGGSNGGAVLGPRRLPLWPSAGRCRWPVMWRSPGP